MLQGQLGTPRIALDPKRMGLGAGYGNFPGGYSLMLDFTQNQAYVAGRGLLGLADVITYSGGANGTRVNSAGLIVAATTPRFDYNPVTLAPLGLLVEEARTNSIRNNTMVGVAAGTPGTAPTNWTIATVAGVSSTVVGSGTDNGINYIDIRWAGTASAGGALSTYFEADTGIAASTAQTWTASAYVKLQAGSVAGVNSFNYVLDENTAAGAFVANGVYPLTAPTTASLITQRPSATRTLSGGGTVGRVRPYYYMPVTNGAVVDITLRIGLPQAEQGAFASSVMFSTGAAVTRSADSAVMTGTNFSDWYNQTQGTFVLEGDLAYPANGGNQFLAYASDNSYNNIVAVNDGSMGFGSVVTASGGSFDGTAAVAIAFTANTIFKIAAAYATNNLAVCVNAQTVATDGTATIPLTLTRMAIGSDHAGFNHIGSGHIRAIRYYPQRLPNATLQALTT